MQILFVKFLVIVNEKLEYEEFFKKYNEAFRESDYEFEKKIKNNLKLSYLEWKDK